MDQVNREALDFALKQGVRHLLSEQGKEGYWWGELESNVTMAAEHILLERFLGSYKPERESRIRRYILSLQKDDGSWSIYWDGPGDISITVEAYFALKLSGENPENSQMAQSRNWIIQHGSIAKTRNFTKIWLALFGQFEWSGLPIMPPEAILLPPKFPLNIYAFASWARATMVPILIVSTKKPVIEIPKNLGVSELVLKKDDLEKIDFKRGGKLFNWRNLFLALDRVLRLHEKSTWKPLRQKALKACEEWIIKHQERDGSWGGIQPPWVYSLIALKCLGYQLEHPVMVKGMEGLLTSFALETKNTFTVQPCLSPIWDTALAVTGLREAGVPANDPSLQRAGEWLLSTEVTSLGDWAITTRGIEPGGFPFEFANEQYPDIDDTAEVLIALRLLDLQYKDAPFLRAKRWLRAMQSKNKGWGAFDRDNTRNFVSQIPFCDFGAALDPPTEDVTAHVLEFFALENLHMDERMIKDAINFLWDTQEEDGSWWGRWGVNYIYGLGAAIPALIAAGVDPNDRRIKKALDWLEKFQNLDGGWGETCITYDDPTKRGLGKSTASQTAWGLLALLSGGHLKNATTSKAINYLIRTQAEDGQWDEEAFTGTGFPQDFMLKYHMYRNYWPLWALGRYRRLCDKNPIHLPNVSPLN